ncbi:lysozyme inhibitor LprI family protein [Aquipseudomonas campi]
MHPVRQCLALLTLSSFALLAQADEQGYSSTYSQCMKASGGITVEMLDCIASETKLQDARLNQNYRAATQTLKRLLPQLRGAQRLWIQYRDAECGLQGSLTGGSMDGINRASCFLEMTKTRADQLDSLAQLDL